MIIKLKEIQQLETYMLRTIVKIFSDNKIRYFLNCGSVLGAVRHSGTIPWDMDVDSIVPQTDYERMIKILNKKLSDDLFIDYYLTNKNYHRLFARVGVKGCSSYNLHIDIFPLVGLPRGIKNQLEYSKKSERLCSLFNYKQVNNRKTKNAFNRIAREILSKTIMIDPNRIFSAFIEHCNLYSYETSEYVMNPCGHYGIKNILPKIYFGEGTQLKYEGIGVCVPSRYDVYLSHYYNNYMSYPSEKEQHMWDDFSISIDDEQAIRRILETYKNCD